MAEILKDGNGVRRTFSDLAKAAVQLAEVASLAVTKESEFAASVNATEARSGRRSTARKQIRSPVSLH